jgi:hypothetical protein
LITILVRLSATMLNNKSLSHPLMTHEIRPHTIVNFNNHSVIIQNVFNPRAAHITNLLSFKHFNKNP